jgi:predicted DNA-binding protein
MHNISFQASKELYEKLEKFAALEDRPKSYLLRKALEEYLMDMEEDDEDRKEAMHRLANPEGPNIPWEEVKRKYGLED